MRNIKSIIFMSIVSLMVSGCYSNNVMKNNNVAEASKVQSSVNTQNNSEELTESNKLEDLIPTPDKIIYYHKGEGKSFTKADPKFNTIMELTQKRISNVNGMYSKALNVADIDFQKQNNNTLEFVYSNKISKTWTIKGIVKDQSDYPIKLEFTSLLFPLDGGWEEMMITLPLSQIGPLVHLGSTVELQKYLND